MSTTRTFSITSDILARFLGKQFVKVTNNLVKKAEALEALLVYVVLRVELFVVGDVCEHDTDVVIFLRVELVRPATLKWSRWFLLTSLF